MTTETETEAKPRKPKVTKAPAPKNIKENPPEVTPEEAKEPGAFSSGLSSVTNGLGDMGRASKETWQGLDGNEKAMVGVAGVGALGVAAIADEILAPIGFIGQILLIVGAIFGLAFLGSREEEEV